MIGRRGFLGAMIGLFAVPVAKVAAIPVVTRPKPIVFDPVWAELNVVPPVLGEFATTTIGATAAICVRKSNRTSKISSSLEARDYRA